MMNESYRLLRPYLRGLPLIVIAMVIAYLAASKYLNYVTPMYESTVKVRLADVGEGVPNSNLFKNFDVFATSNKIAAEIEVLKSQVLLEKVLNKVPFDQEIYRVGELRTEELFSRSPISVSFLDTSESHFDRTFDLQVSEFLSYKVTFPGGQVVSGMMGDTITAGGTTLLIDLNKLLLEANPYLKVADNYKFKILSRWKLISQVKANLDILAVEKDVAVLRLSYKSANPEKSQLLVNTLAETYIKDYIDTKYKAANITVKFLGNQIEDILDKLTDVENEIKNYRSGRGITNINQQTETDLRSIAQLKIQQTNLKMRLESIQELEQYINEGQANFLELAPNFEAFTDLLSTEMVKKIKDLQAEKKDLQLVYTEKDDRVQVVDKKISDLTSYLTESISNTRKSLEVQYDNLSEDIVEAEKVLLSVPENERMLTILNREFHIYQESYNFLNEKKIEAEIAQAAKIAFHRIITRAELPSDPISPNRIIIKIVAVILSMFGVIVLIFFVHMAKAKVNDRQTIETRSMTPVISATPKLKSEKAITRHFQREAAQLQVKGVISENQRICFSSFEKKAGAGFNAFNLCKALVKQQKSVLLIELNDCTPTLFEASQEYEGLDFRCVDSDNLNTFTPQKLDDYLKEISAGYDYAVVLNLTIGEDQSIPVMSVCDANFIVLDARVSPAKRITDFDLIKEEYNLQFTYFMLNRSGYNPNIIRESYKLTFKLINQVREIIRSRYAKV